MENDFDADLWVDGLRRAVGVGAREVELDVVDGRERGLSRGRADDVVQSPARESDISKRRPMCFETVAGVARHSMSASCARGAPTVRARRSRSAGFRAAYEAPRAFAADSAVRSSRAFAACAGDASDRASSSAVSASDAYEE